MADVTTNTKTVLVRLTNAAGDGKSYTLDNPKSSITLAQVKTAFSTLINAELLLGNDGTPLTQVESATVTSTEKIKLGDSGIEISVTPNEFVFNAVQGNNGVQVSGSPVVGAYFTDMQFSGNVILENYVFSTTKTQVSVDWKLSDQPTEGSGYLNIVTEAKTVKIPIRVQF